MMRRRGSAATQTAIRVAYTRCCYLFTILEDTDSRCRQLDRALQNSSSRVVEGGLLALILIIVGSPAEMESMRALCRQAESPSIALSREESSREELCTTLVRRDVFDSSIPLCSSCLLARMEPIAGDGCVAEQCAL
jgi:hypothetical protein